MATECTGIMDGDGTPIGVNCQCIDETGATSECTIESGGGDCCASYGDELVNFSATFAAQRCNLLCLYADSQAPELCDSLE